MLIKNKKATMEMSVGTIVTIVLLMSVLVLGLILIKNIFRTGIDVIKMTDDQLKDEINKLFSEDDKVVIYPDTRQQEVRQDEQNGIGLGIRNTLTGSGSAKAFDYEIDVSTDATILQRECQIREQEVMTWFVAGSQKEENIHIPSGDFITRKTLLNIPVGAPLCTIRFSVNVGVRDSAGGGRTSFANDFFFITIKPRR